MTASPTDDLASAERRIQELTKELAEEREQRTATAEILRVISSSPTDPQRVFSEIAASAARLCDGYNAGIFRLDGEHLRLVAHHGPISAVGPVGDGTLPLTRGLPPARAVLDRQILHVADLQTETTEYPEGSDFARRLGFRAALAVPLMRADEPIWGNYDPPDRCTTIHRSTGRFAEVLRRPGRHRHREHSPVRSGAGEQTGTAGIA